MTGFEPMRLEILRLLVRRVNHSITPTVYFSIGYLFGLFPYQFDSALNSVTWQTKNEIYSCTALRSTGNLFTNSQTFRTYNNLIESYLILSFTVNNDMINDMILTDYNAFLHLDIVLQQTLWAETFPFRCLMV